MTSRVGGPARSRAEPQTYGMVSFPNFRARILRHPTLGLSEATIFAPSAKRFRRSCGHSARTIYYIVAKQSTELTGPCVPHPRIL
jgi:hypothetical protein